MINITLWKIYKRRSLFCLRTWLGWTDANDLPAHLIFICKEWKKSMKKSFCHMMMMSQEQNWMKTHSIIYDEWAADNLCWLAKCSFDSHMKCYAGDTSFEIGELSAYFHNFLCIIPLCNRWRIWSMMEH